MKEIVALVALVAVIIIVAIFIATSVKMVSPRATVSPVVQRGGAGPVSLLFYLFDMLLFTYDMITATAIFLISGLR